MTADRRAGQVIKAGGRDIKLTNPSKLLFGTGVTKRDLVDYYLAAAGVMLPFLRDRPVVMMRYPDGIDGARIVQKNIPDYFPGWIARAEVPKRDGGTVCHVVCNDAATLAYLANQAVIEPHVFSSRTPRLACPQEIVFDLDPAGGTPAQEGFDAARRGALRLRELLESEAGLVTYAKTTGGHGMHVHLPLNGRSDFDEARDLARAIADILVARHPEDFTTSQRVAGRSGKVYLDVMRNAYAQTVICPYGVRGRAGAPVAVPLRWAEVEDSALVPSRFTLRGSQPRLAEIRAGSDPWADYGRHRYGVGAVRKKVGALAEPDS